MQVWLAEATAQQRTLLVSRHEPQRGVETSDVVLSFSASAGRCTLSVLHASDLVWTHMQRLSSPSVPLLGILGLLKMGTDTYLACITHAERVGSLHADQWIRRVRGVTFFCINRAVRDEEFQYGIDPQEYGRSTTSSAPTENPCASIRKYMNSGSFFFAERCAFDLTRRFARIELHSDMDQQFSSQFAWNTYMMEPILQFRTRLDPSQRAELDSAALLVLVIQGYVGMASFPLGPERRDKGTLAVISRLSARRAGTRFNARGIDDQGYAANFAETETVLAFGEDVMSFVQVRGSVPLFWEQQGLQALNARIQITRVGAATQLAFEQHMQRLLDEYERVFALDLLGTRDAETMLSQGYVQHIDAMLAHLPLHGDEKPLRYYNFDFHTITKATGGLDGTRAELDRLNNVQTQRQYNGYTVAQYHPNYVEHVMTQTGVFRVNCFDCLDRTNVVQGCLSHAALRDFFRTLAREKYDDANLALLRDTPGLPEALWPLHGRLWAENGDTLSQISTGTGSLNSDYTRSGSKKFFAGLLSDAAKSASRMYMNNFQDQSKQQAIDTLLGTRSGQEQVVLYDPVYTAADEALARRKDEYATRKRVRLFVGTYNVCAQPPQQLEAWLREASGADIVALSFQELVPLTAQQMLTSSAAEPMRQWERMVLAALHIGTESYVVLRSELLFATGVLLLVRETMLPHVRNVEAASKKTGMRGMSGNKGGIAVRMDIFDTDLCVVGAHLAAGSTSVDERNSDYASIARGIQFPRGRTIDAHTHVVWAGDLNYRFDQLSSAEVRGLCAELPPSGASDAAAPEGVLRKLQAHDQLKLAQASQAAFAGYQEGPITFRPTYKYDIHTDTYDSSEKARAPAWTDRVLWRTKMHETDAVRLTTYACADLRISDHRPVHAQLDVLVYAVDTAKRAALQKELVGAAQQSVPSAPPSDNSTSLPPPSDDAQQWWNQGAPLRPSTDATLGNPFVEAPPSLPARPRGAAAAAVPPPPPPRPSSVIAADDPTSRDTREHASSLSARVDENPAAPPPIPRRPNFS